MPKPALLLGNGFSRAYNNDIFDYAALQDAAPLTERLAEVFEAIDTSDFELVMRRLDEAALLAPIYEVPRQCTRAMSSDVKTVREALIEAIREHHPSGAHMLEPQESSKCAEFLTNFARLFTLNYDLLLYWVIVKYLTGQFEDGFWYGIWRGPEASGQNVYYLHGALHLYDTGVAVRKLSFGEEVPILSNLALRLRRREYPLFVSEGSWEQKLGRIRANPYLQDAYEHLSRNTRPLYIYGFKFGSNDRHIVDAIASSKTPALRVVLHSESTDAAKERVKERAHALAERIKIGAKVRLSFRESKNVHIWR